MEFTRLFTNQAGVSCFEKNSFQLAHSGDELVVDLAISSLMTINETPAGFHYVWHNAPRKQWVITLSGKIKVQLRDGTSQTFSAGDIILAEDLSGSGHATTVISDTPWRCAYIPCT